MEDLVEGGLDTIFSGLEKWRSIHHRDLQCVKNSVLRKYLFVINSVYHFVTE